MRPTVLMVVPTLGERLELLAKCLDSITSQGVAGLDLVVVAPHSSEVTTLVEAHGARMVSDPRNGISAALNAGFDAGLEGTAYCAWIGDDDLLAPGSLQATVGALDSHPRATMVYGWCDYLDANGPKVLASRAGGLAARILTFRPKPTPPPAPLPPVSFACVVCSAVRCACRLSPPRLGS